MARFHLAVFRTIAYLICRLALSALISKITIAQHNSRLIMETAGIATQDAKFWAQLLHDMCRAEAASAYALARARWHVLVSAPVEHAGGKKAALNSDGRRPRCGWRDLSPAPQLGVAEPRLERLCGACSLQQSVREHARFARIANDMHPCWDAGAPSYTLCAPCRVVDKSSATSLHRLWGYTFRAISAWDNCAVCVCCSARRFGSVCADK